MATRRRLDPKFPKPALFEYPAPDPQGPKLHERNTEPCTYILKA